MIGLTREISRQVVIESAHLERLVTQVTPKHRRHAELVGVLKGLRHFDDLARRIRRAKVNGGAHGHGAHVPTLLDGTERNLLRFVGVSQKLVVVELHDERDFVGVLARHRAQHAERAGHGVAPAFERQPHDVLGVEVVGVLGKRCPG